MSRGSGTVEVVPATVHVVLDRVRAAGRDCFQAAVLLNGHTPLMPLLFTIGYRRAVEGTTARLLGLAAECEWLAVTQGLRLALVEGAAGEGLELPLGELGDDAGWAARTAFDQLSAERGTDLLADPAAQEVHKLLGGRDMLVSVAHTLAVLIMGSPMYGTRCPGGRQARQELVAMAINASRTSPAWTVLEPQDGIPATGDLVGRVVDVQDLGDGDPFRWAGHLVSGYALGKMFDGLAQAAPVDAASGGSEAVAAGGEAAWPLGRAGARVYRGVNEANKLPVARREVRARGAAGKAIVAAEKRAASFLENVVP